MIARNFSFNLAGKILPVIISLIAIPIYVRYLGIANYALIGIFTSFSAFAGIFDTGFSNTINREVAKNSGSAAQHPDLGPLFRTLEVFAWTVALTIGFVVVAASGAIVSHWLAAHSTPSPSLFRAVELMGLLLMLQAPLSFYNGSLYGLHQHGVVNVVVVANALASAVVSIAVLIFASSTIEAFFLAQFVCRLVTISIARHLARREMLKQTGNQHMFVSWRVWRSVWRFAVSMNGIGILGLVAGQADMVILSRMLSLKEFGYYALARTVAQGLSMLGTAVFQTSFPHLSLLIGRGDYAELVRTYHRYCQILSLLVVPMIAVLSLYAHDALLLWTHSQDIAQHTGPILSLLAIGWGINSMGNVPSAFMLSRGVTHLIFFTGAGSVVLMVPVMVLLTLYDGATGAAFGWMLVNAFLVLVSLPLMYRWYMPHQFVRWFSIDVGLPVLAAFIPAALVKIAVPVGANSGALLLRLCVAAVLCQACCSLSLPEGRRSLEWIALKLGHYRALLSRSSL